MIQEFLVLLACTNTGCPQTTAAYYQSHPELKEATKHVESKAKNIVGPEIILVSPIALYAAKGEGTFHITKYISLVLSTKSHNMVVFKTDF